MQKHIDTNADITVSCLPMDDRYIYMKHLPDMVSFNFYTECIQFHLLEAEYLRTTISFHVFCSRASDYGLMKIDGTGRIIQFAEKPKGSDLKAMVINCISSLSLLTSIFTQIVASKFNIVVVV